MLEKSVGEEINWFSPFDCVGIKTQSCSPSAGLTLTASTMGNTFSSQQDKRQRQRQIQKQRQRKRQTLMISRLYSDNTFSERYEEKAVDHRLQHKLIFQSKDSITNETIWNFFHSVFPTTEMFPVDEGNL